MCVCRVGTLQSVFSSLAASAAAAASLQSHHGEIESGDGARKMKGEREGCRRNLEDTLKEKHGDR